MHPSAEVGALGHLPQACPLSSPGGAHLLHITLLFLLPGHSMHFLSTSPLSPPIMSGAPGAVPARSVTLPTKPFHLILSWCPVFFLPC